jgi:hypothetical protein
MVTKFQQGLLVPGRQQEEEEEARRVTCLDFGLDRHKLFKGTRANFCDKCDKFESLKPHKKTEKRFHTNTYWYTVKGHVVNIPSKTNKGWLNTHYSLEININDQRVIQSLVPPTISVEPYQESTASPSHAASPAVTNTTEANETNVHTPDETDGNSIQVCNGLSSRRSWSSICAN